MRELPNRIVIHLENSLDDEKEFIKDIMRFGLMSRHVCAVALLNAFRNEIEVDKKKALAVEIAHQRYMAMEDVLQICTALRVSAGDASTTIHFEIERQYKDSNKKETLASIKSKKYLSELGLTKSKLHKMYTKHFNGDVTQTVIKCQWKVMTDGHAKLIKIYNEYYHDLNKIKHGYALISNITNYLPGKLSEDYDTFICSLRNSGAYLDAQLFTALEDSVPDKHVEDIKKINGNMLTLFHAFVLIRHQRDKEFVKDINDIFSNLAKQFK